MIFWGKPRATRAREVTQDLIDAPAYALSAEPAAFLPRLSSPACPITLFYMALSADRFIAPRYWPHRGTYLFHNVADTIHFMAIVPVKAGTTDQQNQAFFNSGSQSRCRSSAIAHLLA